MKKVLSYNLYCIKNTRFPIPGWKMRQELLGTSIRKMLKDEDIILAFFQEVTDDNLAMLSEALIDSGFIMFNDYPMTTDENILEYNVVGVRKSVLDNLVKINCVPHGRDDEYQMPNCQHIDYEMSDYRTTIFVHMEFDGKTYVFGNIHTDYISVEGKIKGVCKSLHYLSNQNCDYGFIVGDMNMVSHMAETYRILKECSSCVPLSKENTVIRNYEKPCINSYHGYGLREEVNVDFAFIPKEKSFYIYNWQCIKQESIFQEGSDHRPVIITIHDEDIVADDLVHVI